MKTKWLLTKQIAAAWDTMEQPLFRIFSPFSFANDIASEWYQKVEHPQSIPNTSYSITVIMQLNINPYSQHCSVLWIVYTAITKFCFCHKHLCSASIIALGYVMYIIFFNENLFPLGCYEAYFWTWLLKLWIVILLFLNVQ